MLRPSVVLELLVATFQSIPNLVAAVGGDPAQIAGHRFTYGVENSLYRSIYQQESPSVLIAYMGIQWGNFSGQTLWHHRLDGYLRPKNAAMGTQPAALDPPDIWWLMMHEPVPGYADGNLNIRSISLVNELMPLAMPELTHRPDLDGSDLFCGAMLLAERGDD